jgi:integrase
MASILPVPSGFRAAVFVNGIRKTKQFRTRREAGAWAAAMETELRSMPVAPAEIKHTLLAAFDRYAEEVAPAHKGERWEQIRLALLAKSLPSAKKISQITASDIATWRDARLKQVSASSVLREMKLLGSVFEIARKEWQWVALNPVRDVRKPRSPEHRQRTITTREIHGMLKALGHRRKKRVTSMHQAIAVLFLVALRTGMRAGELCNLTWRRVHPQFCRLVDTKTGKPRDVPLSQKARRTIEMMRGWDEDLVFGIKSSTLDTVFRRYRERAGLEGFTFHDARHTAATWMAKKIDVLDLCKVFGWSSTKMALVYYNPTAEDIAEQLPSGKNRRCGAQK